MPSFTEQQDAERRHRQRVERREQRAAEQQDASARLFRLCADAASAAARTLVVNRGSRAVGWTRADRADAIQNGAQDAALWALDAFQREDGETERDYCARAADALSVEGARGARQPIRALVAAASRSIERETVRRFDSLDAALVEDGSAALDGKFSSAERAKKMLSVERQQRQRQQVEDASVPMLDADTLAALDAHGATAAERYAIESALTGAVAADIAEPRGVSAQAVRAGIQRGAAALAADWHGERTRALVADVTAAAQSSAPSGNPMLAAHTVERSSRALVGAAERDGERDALTLWAAASNGDHAAERALYDMADAGIDNPPTLPRPRVERPARRARRHGSARAVLAAIDRALALTPRALARAERARQDALIRRDIARAATP